MPINTAYTYVCDRCDYSTTDSLDRGTSATFQVADTDGYFGNLWFCGSCYTDFATWRGDLSP